MGMVAPEDPATVDHVCITVCSYRARKTDLSRQCAQDDTHATEGCRVLGEQGALRLFVAGYVPQCRGNKHPDRSRAHPKADRTYQNLVACKNFYMDVDVKEDGYASTVRK